MSYLNPLFSFYSLSVKALSLVPIPAFLRSFIYRGFGSLVLGMSKRDFEESAVELREFKNISEFFSRPVKVSLRPIGKAPLVFPSDGTVLESGKIFNGLLLSVKGTNYTLEELFCEHATCQKFKNGNYINIYLSPRNYHRFHIPCDGKITHIQHIPGCCIPVNRLGRKVKKLYALNERYIVQISNKDYSVCLAIVGAAAVRGIKLFKAYGDIVHKGNALGMFELGSSIVLISDIDINNINADDKVRACSNI